MMRSVCLLLGAALLIALLLLLVFAFTGYKTYAGRGGQSDYAASEVDRSTHTWCTTEDL